MLTPDVVAPFLNYGVVGACVVVLGVNYALERKRCNELQEKRIEDVKEIESRYRSAMEKMNQALDSLTKIVERVLGKG